jgi:hypothetical protein
MQACSSLKSSHFRQCKEYIQWWDQCLQEAREILLAKEHASGKGFENKKRDFFRYEHPDRLREMKANEGK